MISSPAKQQYQQNIVSVSLPPPPPPPPQAISQVQSNTATTTTTTAMMITSPTIKSMIATPPSVPSIEDDIDCDGTNIFLFILFYMFFFLCKSFLDQGDDDVFEITPSNQSNNSTTNSIQKNQSNHLSNNNFQIVNGGETNANMSNQNAYLKNLKENGISATGLSNSVISVDNNNKQYSISCSTPSGVGVVATGIATTTTTSNQFSSTATSQVQGVKIESAAEIQAAAKRRTQSCSAIQGNVNKEPQSPVSKVKFFF